MRLFGQLEAADGGAAFVVRGAKQRALLALLALHRGEPVSADRLIDALWGDGQAANPVNALQAQIGQLPVPSERARLSLPRPDTRSLSVR